MRVMYTPQTRWWPHDHTRRTHYATVPAHPSLRHGVQRLALPASRSGRAAPAPLPLSSRLALRGTSTGLHSNLFVTLPEPYHVRPFAKKNVLRTPVFSTHTEQRQ